MTDNSPSQISSADTHMRRRVRVRDTEMAYVDVGSGDPIVFLHGNPTSSYLWRNVIAHVADLGRCLAPDLVGMGDSGKSPDPQYRFFDQQRYLDEWFEVLGLQQKVILVLHDWGSALGFSWAHRHQDRVQGIAYMEAIVQPRLWNDFPNGRDQAFRALRSERGESMILDENFFVEQVLPRSVLRPLGDDEMAVYRKPFERREDRLPTLHLARDLPIEGSPEDVAAEIESYASWLSHCAIPKLLVSAEPGALLTGRSLQFCRTWKHQTEVSVKGIHYVQEDSPHEIGAALRSFVASVR